MTELPLPDYDQTPIGALRHRIRSSDELRVAGQTPRRGRP